MKRILAHEKSPPYNSVRNTSLSHSKFGGSECNKGSWRGKVVNLPKQTANITDKKPNIDYIEQDATAYDINQVFHYYRCNG